MNIIIKTKNLELTDSLRVYINQRIDGLKKFITILNDDSLPIGKGKTLSEVFIEVEKETLHHKKGQIFRTEATIHLPGKHLVAEAKGDDLGKTITQVRDELKREIKKYKLKKIELPRRQAKKLKDIY
ncbi:MAG: hypothetical protein UR31_C0030G0003 [Parcubacteria group bacterium GW2011_GWA2_33_14]|uniref:Ribosomal subunit interface protein n=1 Tax=Candidatus Staskawiczbacteria bacterium RIFCSPHIGHO2_02_FULL_33_16 TaxID=1802204 RepID=A0A1G2HX06_9BACT|nr:MAG: hypothetical protein UR31_C0030G0003 [Parcubacteria group bacterium GW2011_GWA2_33_14]OGZ67015.1 MAG: ribosomal subunit interface protein [Candidatus Staskawiczbacteria bacterium RIFCSPHIGHO2_02_FULL_33_16]OGZ71080.1 MAG: ribosomal subunit interface protein [Candidatus Staskawiczbacteria bacterium RIFCSPLOWO2_01_FULL_33_13]